MKPSQPPHGRMSQSLLLSKAQPGTAPISTSYPLADIVPIHTHRGWHKLRALPKTTQLEGCSLDSNPGLPTSQTCVLNHYALLVGDKALLISLCKADLRTAVLDGLPGMAPKGPAAPEQDATPHPYCPQSSFTSSWESGPTLLSNDMCSSIPSLPPRPGQSWAARTHGASSWRGFPVKESGGPAWDGCHSSEAELDDAGAGGTRGDR